MELLNLPKDLIRIFAAAKLVFEKITRSIVKLKKIKESALRFIRVRNLFNCFIYISFR